MKRITRIAALVLSLVMLFALCACGSSSSSKYPSSAITMIVNYSAGGGTDLAARALADAAAKQLGGTITVTNVTGGSGTVGVTELANSKNDGYTIGVATLSPLTIMPWQLEVTYTPDSFEYICVFGQYGYGIVVPADSPYETLDDLIAAAQDPAGVNFGYTGFPQPLSMEELGAQTGATFNRVNYTSTSDMIAEILGGFLPCAMADYASFAQYVESGDMRLLASAIETRWPVAEDVPTLQEMGYDIVCGSYMGIAVPADTPDDIVEALREAFKAASEDETYKETLENCNLTWNYMTGEEYEALVYEKYDEYKAAFAG